VAARKGCRNLHTRFQSNIHNKRRDLDLTPAQLLLAVEAILMTQSRTHQYEHSIPAPCVGFTADRCSLLLIQEVTRKVCMRLPLHCHRAMAHGCCRRPTEASIAGLAGSLEDSSPTDLGYLCNLGQRRRIVSNITIKSEACHVQIASQEGDGYSLFVRWVPLSRLQYCHTSRRLQQ
jgi:hypothetical protein